MLSKADSPFEPGHATGRRVLGILRPDPVLDLYPRLDMALIAGDCTPA